jgi:hypothetical protein
VLFKPVVKDKLDELLAVCVDISIRLSVGTAEGKAVMADNDVLVAYFKAIKESPLLC